PSLRFCFSFSRSLCLAVFLLIPPPPRTTLFPYTTLFRSRLRGIQHDRSLYSPLAAAGWHKEIDDACRIKGEQRERMFIRDGYKRDRKSTRLNSSHVKISYAVFCLKKKKKTT